MTQGAPRHADRALRDLAALLSGTADTLDGRSTVDLAALVGRIGRDIESIDGCAVFASLAEREGLARAMSIAKTTSDALSDLAGWGDSLASEANAAEVFSDDWADGVIEYLDDRVQRLRAAGLAISDAELWAVSLGGSVADARKRIDKLRREAPRAIAQRERLDAQQAERDRKWEIEQAKRLLERCA